MRHRSQNTDSFFDDLFVLFKMLPVWVGPLVAAICYASLAWLIPWIFQSNEPDASKKFVASAVIGFTTTIAPFAPFFILMIWAGARFARMCDSRERVRKTKSTNIRSMSWQDFELLISELYQRQGFTVDHCGSNGGDGGVDQRIRKDDQLSLVQCKHWRTERVGVSIVRELLGVVTSENADYGILVTSGSFTEDATEFARRNPIELVDGDKLIQLMDAAGLTHNEPREPEASPKDQGHSDQTTPCPACGSDMTIKTNRRGSNPGSKFWGCSRFPTCRYTRNIRN